MKIPQEDIDMILLPNFAVRAEFEDCAATPDYISGYIKGVASALFDLGAAPEVVTAVKTNLTRYRAWCVSDSQGDLQHFLKSLDDPDQDGRTD